MSSQPKLVPPAPLGRSGLVSSRLGLGCAGWPDHVSHEQIVQVFRAAFELGIRHIDVAEKYGTEEAVGRAIKDAGAPKDMVLATKVGTDEQRRFTADYARMSVERSLKRLQVDQLDILHIHDCGKKHMDQVFGPGGMLEALLQLKQQGLFKSLGMATWSLSALKAAIESGVFDQVQTFHAYTLLNQQAMREIIPMAKARNLPILNNGPYAGYILLSGATLDARYQYHTAPAEVIEMVKRIEAVCARKSVSIATAALAFSLQNPDVDVTVIGASSPDKLRERAAAFNAPLSQPDFDEMLAAAGGMAPIHTD